MTIPTVTPVYRLNQLVHLPLDVSAENFETFTGTLEVEVWQGEIGNGFKITSGPSRYVLDGSMGGVTVSFILIADGEYKISFEVKNNISRSNLSVPVAVASESASGMGGGGFVISGRGLMLSCLLDYDEYEYFRLFFESKDTGNDYDWLVELQDDIIRVLSEVNKIGPQLVCPL